MGKAKGALEGAKGVEGERACEKLEFMLNLMASDSLQVPPPPSTCTRGGGTNKSGGLYDHREDKKRGRERVRESMCFPQAHQQLRDNDLCFSQNSGISKCYI